MVEVKGTNMNSNSVQSDTSQTPSGFQPASPASSWRFHAVDPKREDHEDRNDSGISGSDFHSSPGSDRSENIPGSDQMRDPNYCLVPSMTIKQPTDPLIQQPSSLPPIFNVSMTENYLKRLEAFHNKMPEENTSDQDKVFHAIKVPKVKPNGKGKVHKCKYCDFMGDTKSEVWLHTRIHIKKEKQLDCPHCDFVTEYKHHLEYHIHNHFGSKPFQCSKCQYTCVNKSMLNSHLKSHSSVYQYRCHDCNYATKYCHSLKIHLRKYKHSPAMVLNPDGTPNPLPIIDVYGTRRGPRVKSQEQKPPDQVLQFQLNALMCNPSPLSMPIGFPCFPNPLLIQNLINRQQAANLPQPQTAEEPSVSPHPQEALDLSKPEKTSTSRRKGRAFKHTPSDEASSDEEETTMFSNVEVVQENATEENFPNRSDYTCAYCDISFGDPVLYTIHISYHGYNDPFTCNRCGEKCHDKIAFSLHVARKSHS